MNAQAILLQQPGLSCEAIPSGWNGLYCQDEMHKLKNSGMDYFAPPLVNGY